jgi:ketosteroid isomerase-like protein
MDTVNRWRAVDVSDRDAVAAVLAYDVEWVVPVRGEMTTLHGIDEVVEWYMGPPGASGPENLDVSEERGELEDLGEGRVGSLNKLTYTWKESGEVAYVKTGRLVYTIRDGKIVRYELEDLREVEREIAGAPAH